MPEFATTMSVARIGWQVLAKVPWLTGWLLRRAFPVAECRSLLCVDIPGNHARFELMSVRPSAALAGLEVRVFNPLPFALEFETFRLTASVASTALFDAVLNTRHLIPAASSAHIPLAEIGLSDQQANWVRVRQYECERIQLNLYWRCRSVIHNWDGQGTYECLAQIRKDGAWQSQ